MPFNMNTVDGSGGGGVYRPTTTAICTGGASPMDDEYYSIKVAREDVDDDEDDQFDGYRHQWTPPNFHMLPQTHKTRLNCSTTPSSSTASYQLDESEALVPVPVVSRSPSNIFPFPVPPGGNGLFDQQEKVRVRLVQNRGLVVEEPPMVLDINGQLVTPPDLPFDCDIRSGFSSYDFIRPSPIVSHASCVDKGKSCPGHSTKLSVNISQSPSPTYLMDDVERGGDCSCESTSNSKSHKKAPFSRTRHGSPSACGGGGGGGVGGSCLTPLMTPDIISDRHKIQVIVKPSSTMKNQQGGSNIHLYCALVFGFSASLFFSLTLLLAKVLKNRDHHPISIAFWRYLGILVPSIPLGLFYFLRGKKHKVVGSVWPIQDMDKAANALALLMRGVLGSTAIILQYCSLKYLSIGDSSVISYAAPVFAAIFTPLCIKKDKGGVIPVLFAMVTAFGIFVVCQPPFLGGGGGYNAEILKGVFLATLSMFCTTGVIIIVRNLLEKVHFSLMMLVLGVWGVFEAGVLALSLDVLRVPELLPDILMMLGVAILTFFGHLFVLLAMRMGQVGSVTVMRSCDIFLSILWQYLFFKTEPGLFGILSATLIIFAVWFICFRKWLITLRENHIIRQRLSVMLY